MNKKVYLQGKPVHDSLDPFSAKHPKMDVAKRAKIFAPFDALRGFSAAILAEEGKKIETQEPRGETARPWDLGKD